MTNVHAIGDYPPYGAIWVDPHYNTGTLPAPANHTWSATTFQTTARTGAFPSWLEAMAFASGLTANGATGRIRIRRQETPFATRWVVRWTPRTFTY